MEKLTGKVALITGTILNVSLCDYNIFLLASFINFRYKFNVGENMQLVQHVKSDDSAQNRFSPLPLGQIVCFCNRRSSAYLRLHGSNQPYLQWVRANYMGRSVRPACEGTDIIIYNISV